MRLGVWPNKEIPQLQPHLTLEHDMLFFLDRQHDELVQNRNSLEVVADLFLPSTELDARGWKGTYSVSIQALF
jgi:hypothetical protein